LVIVDLCCGSGALALALKRRFPVARVVGTDISTAALELAQANATRNQLDVEWKAGYLFGAVPDEVRGRIDLLVANPPYVANSDWDNLPVDVRWEPRIALLAGDRGTEVIEAILDDLARWMSPGGIAWIEVGDGQAPMLTGSHPVTAIEDQYGVPRYLRLEVGSAGT
jgi:release factor glutamine methyltransferase